MQYRAILFVAPDTAPNIMNFIAFQNACGILCAPRRMTDVMKTPPIISAGKQSARHRIYRVTVMQTKVPGNFTMSLKNVPITGPINYSYANKNPRNAGIFIVPRAV